MSFSSGTLRTVESPCRSGAGRALPACLLCAVLASAAGAQTISNIGSLASGSPSGAFGVDSDGSTVVGSSATPSGARAVRWTSTGGLQSLGVLPGGIRSDGYAISADGAVVTGICVLSGTGHAFRWTVAGGMQDLGTLAGQTFSYGYAVSGDGLVVAGGPGSSGPGHAFRWTSAGGMMDLGTLAGGGTSAIYGLNADGSAGTGVSGSPGGGRAVLWTSAGGMQDLGVLPGGTFSEGDAISADGAVITGLSGSPGGQRAFRWTMAGGMRDLGTVSGRSMSAGTAISADGSVIVGYDEAGAILWTEALGMVDLPGYLGAQGVNLAGWTLTACYGISADGTALVGTGFLGGLSRGWVVRGLPSLCAPFVTAQPDSATACPTGSTDFAVTASGGDSLTYEWQIETTPRAWATLGRMPMALPCGGSAFSLSPFTAETQIGVRACPGISSYSIRCVVSNACGTAASNAATYTVCAADFNCDGLANSQDFFDFDGAFFAGDPAADFNGDGVINSQDFFDYLSAFFGGC